MKEKKINLLLKAVLGGIAIVYALAFLKIIILKNGFDTGFRGLQLVPFSFMKDLVNNGATLDVWLKNVAGNTAIFIPLSIIAATFFDKMTFGKTVIFGCATSFVIEVIQYITGLGLSDIDDFILNSVGALIGALLYFGLFKRAGKYTLLISVLFLSVFGCCGVLSLWLYHPSALPTKIESKNVEILGVGKDTYNIDASCFKVDDTTIYLSEGSAAKIENEERVEIDVKSYPLAKDAELFTVENKAKYSPNGNVQSICLTYDKTDIESVNKNIKDSEGSLFVSIWLNDKGECEKALFTIYAK